MFSPALVCPFGIADTTTSCAHPISYTVGWQGVVIPRNHRFLGCTTDQMAIFISPHTAIAPLADRDFALVLTERTLNTLRPGRRQAGKAKPFATLGVNFLKLAQTSVVSTANTLGAKRQYFSCFFRNPPTFLAGSHNAPPPFGKDFEGRDKPERYLLSIILKCSQKQNHSPPNPQLVIVREPNRTNFVIRVTKYFDVVNEIRHIHALAYAGFLKVSEKCYNGNVVFMGDTSIQKER